MIARFRIGYAPDSGFFCAMRCGASLMKRRCGRAGCSRGRKTAVSYQRLALRKTGHGLRLTWGAELRRTLLPWTEGSLASPKMTKLRAGTGESRGPKPESSKPIYSRFRNRVMFPISNEQGKVIAFTGRTLSTDEKAGPKYLNSPETQIYSKSRVLFNLDQAKEAIRKLEYSILVEGQMDCISVYAAGYHNVIAPRGQRLRNCRRGCWGGFRKKSSSTLTLIRQERGLQSDPRTAGGRRIQHSRADA